MYFAIAVVCFIIAALISANRKEKQTAQQAEYMRKMRKGLRTPREYYYACFEYLELMKKRITFCQELNPTLDHTPNCYREDDFFDPIDRAMLEYWKTLRVDHWTYSAEQYAIGKAREIIIEEGYVPSDVSGYTMPDNYQVWKRNQFRARYEVGLYYPNPFQGYSLSHMDLIPSYTMDTAVKELNEVAQKYGFQDFCSSVLRIKRDEQTGTYYYTQEGITNLKPQYDAAIVVGIPDNRKNFMRDVYLGAFMIPILTIDD